MFNADRLQNYIQRRMTIIDEFMESKRRFNGKILKSRNMLVKIKEHLNNFKGGLTERHWVIIPGLRGTGKTTLLAQTFFFIKNTYKDADVIYFSIDDANTNGFRLMDLLEEYIAQIQKIPETAKNVFILLDEIQDAYDWAKTLKIFYDRCPGIFLVCSGSSAVNLQTNADIAGRRASIDCLYPMSFCEYEFIEHDLYPIPGLKAKINDAIFESSSAQECYGKLKTCEPYIEKYRKSIGRNHWANYIHTGSIPFTLAIEEKGEVYKQILQTVEKVIYKDLPQIDSIDSKSIPVAKSLLVLLAEADSVSVNKVSSILNSTNITISNILSALCKAELLVDIVPYGSNFTAAKKSHKYLFSSSVVRSALNYMNGTGSSKEVTEGRILEDVMGLQFYKRNGIYNNGGIFYDSSQGGADFIIKTGNSAVVFESGRGEKTGAQVEHTMKQIPCAKYGITVCKTSSIRLSDNKTSVFIPWRVFALAG